MVAPCKSGNTAIGSMAESGYTVAHQKIKSALRLVLLEHLGESLSSSEQEYFYADTTPEAVLALPEVTPHTVDARPALIMKETFCAGHKLEAYYDPLTVLLEAGWTPDMLTVVSVVLEPLASFASWVTQYGHNNSHGHPGRDRKAPASSFHAAMAAVSNTRDVARSHVAAAVQRHRALAAHNQRTHGRGDARRMVGMCHRIQKSCRTQRASTK